MSQSVVTVRLNGTPYQIGCGVGEEEHVANLGAEVDTILQSLTAAVGQIGDARLLAMAALILADKAGEAEKSQVADASNRANGGDLDAAQAETAALNAIEAATNSIAALTSALTPDASTPDASTPDAANSGNSDAS